MVDLTPWEQKDWIISPWCLIEMIRQKMGLDGRCRTQTGTDEQSGTQKMESVIEPGLRMHPTDKYIDLLQPSDTRNTSLLGGQSYPKRLYEQRTFDLSSNLWNQLCCQMSTNPHRQRSQVHSVLRLIDKQYSVTASRKRIVWIISVRSTNLLLSIGILASYTEKFNRKFSKKSSKISNKYCKISAYEDFDYGRSIFDIFEKYVW